MKAFTTNLIVLAAFLAGCAAQRPAFNPNLRVNATVEFSGIDKPLPDGVTGNGGVKGCKLTRSCLLLTRQKADWTTSDGQSGSVTFGGYEGSGSSTTAIFQDYNIPDGAQVDVILDASAAPDIDLDVWYPVDYSSPCITLYTCTGSIFKYTYSLVGVSCDSATTVPKFGQCGGIGYTGSTACEAGLNCTVANQFYSQCL